MAENLKTSFFIASVYIILHNYCKPHKDARHRYMPSSSLRNVVNCVIHSFISIQPWRPGLAGTRAQSCDRYGHGTLHPGQVLGGSLPLLSPAFRRSHFSRQVPPSATTRDILAAKGGTVGEKDLWFRLPRKSRDLLHAANLRHGTDGFTSPPKEGVLRTFSP